VTINNHLQILLTEHNIPDIDEDEQTSGDKILQHSKITLVDMEYCSQLSTSPDDAKPLQLTNVGKIGRTVFFNGSGVGIITLPKYVLMTH
jgi:hypothetical protein